MNLPTKNKVRVYITRQRNGQMELLVFTQKYSPESGTQVPGGGVDEGEDMETAAIRELWEESGLAREQLAMVNFLGKIIHSSKVHPFIYHRHFFQITLEGTIPEQFDHIVTGSGIDHNMVFCYKWCPINELPELAASQGQALHLLKQVEIGRGN